MKRKITNTIDKNKIRNTNTNTTDANSNSLIKYLEQQYNDETTSDFVIEDANGNCLYLHKFILKASPFFKTYFDTKVGGKNKNRLRVNNIHAVKILAKYFYSGDIVIPADIEDDLFFEIVDLSNQWFIFENLQNAFRKFINSHWQEMAKRDIKNIALFYNFFRSDNFIYFVLDLKSYLEKNRDAISVEMIDSDIFKKLSEDIQLETIVKFNQFDKIHHKNPIDLRCLPTYLQKYYDPKSMIFSEKQLAALTCAKKYIFHEKCEYHYCHEYTCAFPDCKYCHDVLVINTLIPFQAKRYTALAKIFYDINNKKFSIELCDDIDITDVLYGDDCSGTITIESMYWYGKPVTHGYRGNKYNVEFSDTPVLKELHDALNENGNYFIPVWKVHEL